MYPSPLHADPNSLGFLVISAPIVFLLCWLYNAHRLGKFKRSKDAPPSAAHKKGLFIICCILLCILSGLVIRFMF